MKIRNGFVSNSSSSSYLLGYGEIRDKVLFDNWVKNLGITLIDREEFNINSDNLIEDHYVCSCYSGNCGIVLLGKELKLNKFNRIDSFCSDITINFNEVKDDSYYYIFNFIGNEGDSGYLGTLCAADDYSSFCLEDLENYEQDIFCTVTGNNQIFNTNISSVSFGAGRNG